MNFPFWPRHGAAKTKDLGVGLLFTRSWYNENEGNGSTHKKVSRTGTAIYFEIGVGSRRMKHIEGCPVQATIAVLAGKWKVQIFWHLSFGRLRFAELRKKLPKISEKVLTEHLRQLERDGVIERVVTRAVPPAVSYALNAEGEKLVPIMEALCDWGSKHFEMEPSLKHPAAAAN
jgi:DNA-binding HxlR family transcriptional regulator